MVVKLEKFEIEHLINEMSLKVITVVKCDFIRVQETLPIGVYIAIDIIFLIQSTQTL